MYCCRRVFFAIVYFCCARTPGKRALPASQPGKRCVLSRPCRRRLAGRDLCSGDPT